MDQNFDDEDVRSLSERLLPFTSSSYTNHSPSHNSNSSIKSQKNSSLANQSYHDVLPKTGNIGDIIHLSDKVRKKYNGTSWRLMCSEPNCSYYTQRRGLCKPHLAVLLEKESIPSKDSEKNDDKHSISAEEKESPEDEIITSSNNIRKQYQRTCANPTCTTVVDDGVEDQNGLCSYHYDEYCAKNFSESNSCSDTFVLSSPLRKRRCPNSLSQIPVLFNTQSSIPKTNHRLSIAYIPPSVDINNPKKDDVIEMVNGSRKKFDGVIWRKICSIPGCMIAAQRNELCRKHVINPDDKPTTEMAESKTLATSVSKRISSVSTSSTDEKSEFRLSKMIKDECISNDDNTSNSSDPSDDDDGTEKHDRYHQDNASTIDDDNLDAPTDQTFSKSQHKCSTNLNCLKKWLREHRGHPYPSSEEKIELAKQSSMTYDQITIWFSNARAALRRTQSKLTARSLDTIQDDKFMHGNNEHSACNHKKASEGCRSIGIQCNPTTANQTTSTDISLMTDDGLTSDRTIKILTPSSHVLKVIESTQSSDNQKVLIDNGRNEDFEKDQEIIISSTCLDDDQMTRFNEFCSRFQIKSSTIVDKYTTHLITDEEGQTLVCPLSKKVIQAIAYHMHILTYRWIDSCLKLNHLIDEKLFEIQGDLTLSCDHYGMQRSRQSILPYNLPRTSLLENYSIMIKCDGCQGMMNNDELIELVKLCGAKYTGDSHFARLQTGIIRVVLCEKEYLINRKEIYEKCLHAGVHFVTPEWFLESLVHYCIQPFQEYEISP